MRSPKSGRRFADKNPAETKNGWQAFGGAPVKVFLGGEKASAEFPHSTPNRFRGLGAKAGLKRIPVIASGA
jgi:hypothetical protein